MVDKLNYQLGRLAVGNTRPNREAVVGIALKTNAEETLVLQACPLCRVAAAAQTDIVGIALEGAVIAQLDIAEHAPTHIVVGTELKRAVLHQLGIDAAIGRIVDILEKEAPHRRLDLGSETLGINGDYLL